MNNLTQDERAEQDALLSRISRDRHALAEATARCNAAIVAAFAELSWSVKTYDATIAETAEFCHRVAHDRMKFTDETRPQLESDTRDLGQTWFDAAGKVEKMTGPDTEAPRVWVVDDEAEELLCGLPTRVV